ncbi:hypothetical protein ABI59_07025 [Acidobacteria bacterium Mor1]|nr:hypothetical protein ABI59_07025 [Acidobacteria bacterium Mor1]
MTDRETGLSWNRQVGDERSWEDARAWCEALEFAERDDWRLPSLEELRRLYDTRFEQPCEDEKNPCHVDPALELGGAWFWSGTSGGAGRRYYIDFRFGTEFSPMLKPGLKRRVLCVADAKTGSPER